MKGAFFSLKYFGQTDARARRNEKSHSQCIVDQFHNTWMLISGYGTTDIVRERERERERERQTDRQTDRQRETERERERERGGPRRCS